MARAQALTAMERLRRSGTTILLVSHDLEEAVYLADQVLLLTKRPTRVAEILDYDDPRPRTVETLSEAGFERNYQGTTLMAHWPLELEAGVAWKCRLHFELVKSAK